MIWLVDVAFLFSVVALSTHRIDGPHVSLRILLSRGFAGLWSSVRDLFFLLFIKWSELVSRHQRHTCNTMNIAPSTVPKKLKHAIYLLICLSIDQIVHLRQNVQCTCMRAHMWAGTSGLVLGSLTVHICRLVSMLWHVPASYLFDSIGLYFV